MNREAANIDAVQFSRTHAEFLCQQDRIVARLERRCSAGGARIKAHHRRRDSVRGDGIETGDRSPLERLSVVGILPFQLDSIEEV